MTGHEDRSAAAFLLILHYGEEHTVLWNRDRLVGGLPMPT